MQVKTVLSNNLSISWLPMQFYRLAEILEAQLDNSELPYGEMKVWLCDIWDWPPFLICVTHMELQIRHQVFQSRLLSASFSRRCNSCTVMGSEVSTESSHIETVPTKYRERQDRSASQRKNLQLVVLDCFDGLLLHLSNQGLCSDHSDSHHANSLSLLSRPLRLVISIL